MIVLGIESSCDESAVAVVQSTPQGPRILSNVVLSQLEDHRPYGGVVPEIAARAHLEHLDSLVMRAMAEAGLAFEDLTAVAATAGPGLIGGVIVGLMTGKGIAFTHDKPFLAINHLEGHALSVRLVQEVPFPYLLLLVSGGHCQLLVAEAVGRYHCLGTTIDDAVGEAFDKTAKVLGLGYPGGPALEALARQGRGDRFSLPRPMLGRPGCDFSFSGLKTAARQAFMALESPGMQDRADLAIAFQAAVCDVLADRSAHAMKQFRNRFSGAGERAPSRPHFVIAGGVAANRAIRTRLAALATEQGFTLTAPPIDLCTDNAAMIAWAGIERLRGGVENAAGGLAAKARARWPLDAGR